MHLDECALNRRLSNPAAQTKQMAAIRAAPLWPRASLAAMARGEPAGRLNRLEYQKVAEDGIFFAVLRIVSSAFRQCRRQVTGIRSTRCDIHVIQRGGAYCSSAVVLKIRQSQPIAERAQNFPAGRASPNGRTTPLKLCIRPCALINVPAVSVKGASGSSTSAVSTPCLNIDTLTTNSACLSAACAAAGFAASYSTSTFNNTTARRGCSNSSAADKPPTSGSAPAM